MQQLIDKIDFAILDANYGVSKLIPGILTMQGMSSNKNRHFLNNMVDEETNYLEIGTWQGSTFISAMYNNKPKKNFVIDNFSEFGNPKINLLRYLNRFLGKGNYNFIEADCFTLGCAAHGISDINLYFYDGNHDEESQYKALTYFYPAMADVFVFMVDDWNFEHVVRGTRKAIQDTGVRVVREWELPANKNGDLEGWWNGLFVALMEKQHPVPVVDNPTVLEVGDTPHVEIPAQPMSFAEVYNNQ